MDHIWNIYGTYMEYLYHRGEIKATSRLLFEGKTILAKLFNLKIGFAECMVQKKSNHGLLLNQKINY